MNRLAFVTVFAFCLMSLIGVPSPAQAEVRIGGGVHYWTALGDIEVDDVDIEESGSSFLGSIQWVPGGLFKFEGNLEYFSEGFGGGDSDAWSPQAFVLLGSGLYGGLGIGVTYNDELQGENWSDPYYTARVGLDIEVLPAIHIDVNANYLFNAFSEIDGADEDSITLGAIARIALW
ncbi:MAG: hypothetical protein OEU92_06990 [Alphaproteobacteria bacterium]|nr:hypothetical protein [Alphaproteobacteria bacterium]